MSVRKAVVAGQFYSGNPQVLQKDITGFFARAKVTDCTLPGPNAVWSEQAPLLTMLPHAGYIYCGQVMADTLQGIDLPQRMIILAPSHTGQGADFGYWPEGAWETPLGPVPVDANLGRELAALGGGFTPDETPHLRDHDIEVLLPFLRTVRPDLRILPIVVRSGRNLGNPAQALAGLIRAHLAQGSRLALIVSSDMNHYADDATGRRLDGMALDAMLALDAQALADVVGQNKISMCGVLPAIIGLLACRELGAASVKLMSYDNSGTASGQLDRVVGYAGIRIW